jgi:signal peptidase II
LNIKEKKMELVKKAPKDYIIYSAIIVVGIILDQVTKALAVAYLKAIETLPLIEGVLHLTYAENTGMAFGMLKEHRWVFMVTSTILILAMGFYLYAMKSENRLYDVAIAMVVSGGIGNMIDRIGLGYVVDFIDFRLINFAVFNGADSFVCVGAGLLMLALIRDLIAESKKAKEATNAPAAEANTEAMPDPNAEDEAK